MPSRVIRSKHDLDVLGPLLYALKFPITVHWVQGCDRSNEQNNIMWKWATEVAQQCGDRTASEIQRDWKLRHGVPILRTDDPEFRSFYDRALKPLPFEEKAAAMEYVPVTRLLKVTQMRNFLDAVQRECLENGFTITDPEREIA